MKWRAIAGAALLWSAAGTAAAVGYVADVTIFDRGAGRVLPVYRHEGRLYVAGRPGNEYEVRVRNRAGAQILAVVSVDGVNAVSGETANWHQTGYVLAPYQTLKVEGWRKSLQRVAAFYFTEHANSYAARTGRPQNVGVIGVALFRKRVEPEARIDRPRPRAETWRPAEESPFPDDADAAGQGDWRGRAEPAPFEGAKRESGNAAAGAAPGAARDHAPRARRQGPGPYAAEKSSSLGTGHGRGRASTARYTSFERATRQPAEVVAIHYDSYQNLVRLGVIGTPRIATPFPGQFVPDPL